MLCSRPVLPAALEATLSPLDLEQKKLMSKGISIGILKKDKTH